MNTWVPLRLSSLPITLNDTLLDGRLDHLCKSLWAWGDSNSQSIKNALLRRTRIPVPPHAQLRYSIFFCAHIQQFPNDAPSEAAPTFFDATHQNEKVLYEYDDACAQ